ncbi:MAG: hydroxyacylglutathione hydrolase [Miltoncostaeaceae bacterium]|nr:hydroxyacylglutathione hydrolase [Miltoncostaeaceae bacterium]
MIFRQVIHDDLGCASYLIGDQRAGVAAVVDPRFEIDDYLDLARYLSVRIEHVLETHTHADHVSGHGRLAAATGARLHVHRAAGADYDHEPIEDGWTLALGRVLVRALHTPGHRPEHTAYELVDTSRGQEPWAVLTGDTIFVGDVARPDLAADPRDGAREMFRSLQRRLLSLPPETEIWPAHVGGSLCGGGGIDMKVSSTIGYERKHNPLLAVRDEETFVRRATEGLPPQPPNFRRIVGINKGPLVTESFEPPPLTPTQVERRLAAGALAVDVRHDVQFDDAHVPGALNLSMLRSGFGTKLAWVVDPDAEIVLIGRHDEDCRQAARLAAAVGMRAAGGYLAGGMSSWREERRPIERTERVPAEDLLTRCTRDPQVQILDVREEAEWRAGHIPGSIHVPYHDLRDVPAGLDPERPIAVICASGMRSGVGASLAQRAGARRAIHVIDGGVGTWERCGGPIEREEEIAAAA